jgi:hypothetical protein
MSAAPSGDALWPSLPLEAWSDTCATLHLWTQIVGKIRLTQTTWTNHSWHVTLYVTSTLAFAQSTYEAAANLAQWDRSALERSEGPP